MSVFNKRRDKEVDIEALWAEKMRKNPDLKRLNPPGSAADIMQAIEYDWDLHIKTKQKEETDDPHWERMFMNDSEDDTELKEMVTQQYPYLKREMVRTKKRKGTAFVELLVAMQPLMIPEDNNKYRDACFRIEKDYNERSGGCGPTEGEEAAMMCLKIYRQVLEADKGPGGKELRTNEDSCWLSCVFYTTAYVEDVRVTPGSAENITYPEPGRDYSIIVRDDLQEGGAAASNGNGEAGGNGAAAEPAAEPMEDPPADATLDQE